jgi:heme O synthase-like polyprenyltransferase
VCRDVESDEKLNIPSLPIVKGIPAVAKMVLAAWIAVAAFTVMTWYYTDLGLVFLVGSMFAAIFLIASAVAFVKTPTAEMGGATFMKSILWFWVFSISLIVDAAVNIQI